MALRWGVVICPKCRGSGWTRPAGSAAPYSRQNCDLCFDANERCSTGRVEQKIAAEWYYAHPVVPYPGEDTPTKVPCPSCQHCRFCHGSGAVLPVTAVEIRASMRGQRP